MRDLIEQRIAEHRERIAAATQLLEDLARKREEVRRELDQRRGAVLALLEVEAVLSRGEGLPQE